VLSQSALAGKLCRVHHLGTTIAACGVVKLLAVSSIRAGEPRFHA